MLRLFTFGGLRIERGGQTLQLPTDKARDLLAYLVTFRDRPHPRPVLAGILWPDLAEEKARRRLSDTLWRIRRVVGPQVILADENALQFNASSDYWLDAERFENLVNWSPDPSTNLPALREAIDLYHGPFLDGFYHDWVLLERERLRGLYLEALRYLLELHKQAGDYESGLTIAQRLVAVEPLHEVAHRELMRLYHLLGRDAEAIAQYHRCRNILQVEVGVAPAPETEALCRAISQRDPLLAVAPSVHLPAPAQPLVFDLDELPLVGRGDERATLLGYLEAAAMGQGRIILLEGETGIGKTRLAQALVAGARWRNFGAVLASASESSVSSSYGLFLAALTPTLTPLRIRQLARLVEPVHLQTAALLLPSIAQVLPGLSPPLDLPPPQAREQLQQALVALVLGLARIAPHLWVLEDLQWADAETLSLLPRLLPHRSAERSRRSLAESRALFLLTGRSADLRANPAVWNTLQALDRTGPLVRYTLTRLDADAIGGLLRHLLSEDDPTLADHLVQESEGVPLYLVETLKTWRDEGHLATTGRGTWRWQGGAPSALPSHLGESIIGHRLSRLSPAADDVLAAAAVIGAEVDFDLLVQVCTPSRPPPNQDASDPRLLATSDELLRLGLLVETDTCYRFSHDQVRQTVYHRMSRSQRQRLHRRVAQAIEILFPEQFESLAHHFAAAGERRPAIHYLTRAAGRACDLFAHQTALALYDRLLGLLSHPGDQAARYDVLRDRAEVLGWTGDRETQGRDLEEMLRLAHALSPSLCPQGGEEGGWEGQSGNPRLADALHLRSEWYRKQGHYQSANEDALAALEIYRRLGDDHAQANLLSQLGWNALYSSNYIQASDHLRQALLIYETLNDLPGQIHCLIGLTSTTDLDGDYLRAFSYGQQCLALADANGDSHYIGRALFNVGITYYDLGDIEAAEAHLHRALQISEATDDRRRQAATHFYLGVVPTERDGDFVQARAHLDAALEIFREVQDLSWEGDALAALGRMALLEEDPATAGRYLRAAYQRRRELDEPAYAVIDLSYLALAELALGDEVAAWQHSREAVAEMETGLSGVEHPQRIYYNHSRLAEATRHWATARAALEEAARIVGERAERIDDPSLREKYLAGLRDNQAIAEAAACQPPPGQLRVCLARASAPAHRRPTPDEATIVIWTVDAGEKDAALARQGGKVALRRHRLLRLLAEAEAAGARPTVADLAGALAVSPRTIRADLAALRRQGYAANTRGHRA
ncbi:MAG: BTAD domain-containing putative transcriptional regulator [Chloroflexota bacterium]|nr:BTAD domain-containing putative transcriptional regulator [Chloroflexota bacterium]